MYLNGCWHLNYVWCVSSVQHSLIDKSDLRVSHPRHKWPRRLLARRPSFKLRTSTFLTSQMTLKFLYLDQPYKMSLICLNSLSFIYVCFSHKSSFIAICIYIWRNAFDTETTKTHKLSVEFLLIQNTSHVILCSSAMNNKTFISCTLLNVFLRLSIVYVLAVVSLLLFNLSRVKWGHETTSSKSMLIKHFINNLNK